VKNYSTLDTQKLSFTNVGFITIRFILLVDVMKISNYVFLYFFR